MNIYDFCDEDNATELIELAKSEGLTSRAEIERHCMATLQNWMESISQDIWRELENQLDYLEEQHKGANDHE